MAAPRAPRPGKKSARRQIDDEPDPAWQKWFREVEFRREAEARGGRRFVVSRIEKDGAEDFIRRRRTEPKKVRGFLRKSVVKTGCSFSDDLALLPSAWGRVVGPNVERETKIFSFKSGVLTVSVFSSALLQEIRQFHQAAILRDLRDVWPASTPLVRVLYRLGQR